MPRKSLQDWFYHFRLTKHLPGISEKFNRATSSKEYKRITPKEKNDIKTAYAATVIDILGYSPRPSLQEEMRLFFKVTAADFSGVRLEDLQKLLKNEDPAKVEKAVQACGMEIRRGVITGRNRPPRPSFGQ